MAERNNQISRRQGRDKRGCFTRHPVTTVSPSAYTEPAPRPSIRCPASATGPSGNRGTSTTPGQSRGKEKAAEADEGGETCTCSGGSCDEDEINPSCCSFCRELWEEGFRCVTATQLDNEKGKKQKKVN